VLDCFLAPDIKEIQHAAKPCCTHRIDILSKNNYQKKTNGTVLTVDRLGLEPTFLNDMDEIVPKIFFIQILIRFVRPVEECCNPCFVGTDTFLAVSPELEFGFQPLLDFFLGHVKNSFVLYSASAVFQV